MEVVLVSLFLTYTGHKMKFSSKDFFIKCDQIQFPADLVIFTEEVLNDKFHFLCSVRTGIWQLGRMKCAQREM